MAVALRSVQRGVGLRRGVHQGQYKDGRTEAGTLNSSPSLTEMRLSSQKLSKGIVQNLSSLIFPQ